MQHLSIAGSRSCGARIHILTAYVLLAKQHLIAGFIRSITTVAASVSIRPLRRQFPGASGQFAGATRKLGFRRWLPLLTTELQCPSAGRLSQLNHTPPQKVRSPNYDAFRVALHAYKTATLGWPPVQSGYISTQPHWLFNAREFHAGAARKVQPVVKDKPWTSSAAIVNVLYNVIDSISEAMIAAGSSTFPVSGYL